MRPIYETSEDRVEEARVMRDVQLVGRIGIRRIRKMFPVDYAILRGPHVVAWAEIKARDYSLEELNYMGGLFLSAYKLGTIKAIELATGIKGVYIAGLTDGIYVARLPEPNPRLPVGFGGRIDRDDPADVEPVCFVPPASWCPLNDFDFGGLGE
jgi:hypothetical protein